MKIRFYHWWVYNLYCKLWSPILAERPEMVSAIVKHMIGWLEEHNGTKYNPVKMPRSSHNTESK